MYSYVFHLLPLPPCYRCNIKRMLIFGVTQLQKIHSMIANLALTNGWCITMILAGISLCLADPFPTTTLNIICIVVFFCYAALKGYFMQFQAFNLLRAFYSNPLQENNV